MWHMDFDLRALRVIEMIVFRSLNPLRGNNGLFCPKNVRKRAAASYPKIAAFGKRPKGRFADESMMPS